MALDKQNLRLLARRFRFGFWTQLVRVTEQREADTFFRDDRFEISSFTCFDTQITDHVSQKNDSHENQIFV